MCVSDWKSRIPVKGNILNSTNDSVTRQKTMASKCVVLHFWAPAHSLLVNLLIRTVICNYPHNRGLVNTLHPRCTNTLGLPSNTSVPLFFQISLLAWPVQRVLLCQKPMAQRHEPRREGLFFCPSLSDNKTEARDPPFTLVLAGNKFYECPRSDFLDTNLGTAKVVQVVWKLIYLSDSSCMNKKPSFQTLPNSHFENKGQNKNSVWQLFTLTSTPSVRLELQRVYFLY